MTGPSRCDSRSRQAGRPADFPGRLKGLVPPRAPLGPNFRSFMGSLLSWVPEYGNFGVGEGDFSCLPRLTLPHRIAHKRARSRPDPGCRGLHVPWPSSVRRQGPARLCCRRAGECPEWQRELTVNQPPYGFEGSSPSSPTIFEKSPGIEFRAIFYCVSLSPTGGLADRSRAPIGLSDSAGGGGEPCAASPRGSRDQRSGPVRQRRRPD